MTFSADPATLVGFLLAMVRTVAWLTTSPPFTRGMVPVRVRLGLGVGLGALLAGSVDASEVPFDTVGLTFAIAYQVIIGVALGFVVQLFFTAFQAAGALIDLSSGFSIGAQFDPLTGNQNATVARLYDLLATVLLFAGGGHVLIVGGFMRSFQAAPLSGPSLEQIGQLLIHGLGTFMVAAIEISFPLIAALLMTEIALALLARAAPQANVLMLGMTVKALVLLTLLGLSLAVLPVAVDELTGKVVRVTFRAW